MRICNCGRILSLGQMKLTKIIENVESRMEMWKWNIYIDEIREEEILSRENTHRKVNPPLTGELRARFLPKIILLIFFFLFFVRSFVWNSCCSVFCSHHRSRYSKCCWFNGWCCYCVARFSAIVFRSIRLFLLFQERGGGMILSTSIYHAIIHSLYVHSMNWMYVHELYASLRGFLLVVFFFFNFCSFDSFDMYWIDDLTMSK